MDTICHDIFFLLSRELNYRDLIRLHLANKNSTQYTKIVLHNLLDSYYNYDNLFIISLEKKVYQLAKKILLYTDYQISDIVKSNITRIVKDKNTEKSDKLNILQLIDSTTDHYFLLNTMFYYQDLDTQTTSILNRFITNSSYSNDEKKDLLDSTKISVHMINHLFLNSDLLNNKLNRVLFNKYQNQEMIKYLFSNFTLSDIEFTRYIAWLCNEEIVTMLEYVITLNANEKRILRLGNKIIQRVDKGKNFTIHRLLLYNNKISQLFIPLILSEMHLNSKDISYIYENYKVSLKQSRDLVFRICSDKTMSRSENLKAIPTFEKQLEQHPHWVITNTIHHGFSDLLIELINENYLKVDATSIIVVINMSQKMYTEKHSLAKVAAVMLKKIKKLDTDQSHIRQLIELFMGQKMIAHVAHHDSIKQYINNNIKEVMLWHDYNIFTVEVLEYINIDNLSNDEIYGLLRRITSERPIVHFYTIFKRLTAERQQRYIEVNHISAINWICGDLIKERLIITETLLKNFHPYYDEFIKIMADMPDSSERSRIMKTYFNWYNKFVGSSFKISYEELFRVAFNIHPKYSLEPETPFYELLKKKFS